VDEAVLRQASRDLRTKQADVADEGAAYATWKRRKERKFWRHFGVWLIVNAAIFILSHFVLDSLSLALLWGIGLGIQGLRTFTAHEDDWREERDNEERKARKKKKRAEAIDRALDEGATVLLETGEALRRRVAAPPRSDGPRLRVASPDVDRDAAAEDEAAAAEQRSGERRRR
jgi:serine/threonine-protein kinase